MDPVFVTPCTVAEFEALPNADALLAEYARESALADLGPACPQWDTYRRMEAAGVVRMLVARRAGEVVGLLVLILSAVPHFGRLIASTESYFVASAARKSGAGLLLLREAERIAREAGAVGFFVSAPVGGRLAQVLPGVGYRETNRLFFRSLAEPTRGSDFSPTAPAQPVLSD